MAKLFIVDDGIGQRERRHLNLLIRADGVIKFDGKDVPPVARVLTESYKKNGKWSCTIYVVECQDGVVLAPFVQDWETGQWLTSKTWDEAFKEFRARLKQRLSSSEECRRIVDELTDTAVENAIRAYLPNTAKGIDALVTSWETAPDLFAELLAAQQELAEANKAAEVLCQSLEADEETVRVRTHAARTREVLAKGKSMNLADLRQALADATAQK